MTPTLWAAFFFAAALIALFSYLLIKGKDFNSTQHQLLRVLTALCAAFGASFFTGDALVTYEYSAAFKLVIIGTSGAAFFLLVYFSTPAYQKEIIPGTESVKFRIEDQWTFEQAAHVIADKAGRPLKLTGFDETQKKTKIGPININAKSYEQALRQLRTGNLPNYHVREADGMFEVYI